MEGTWIFVIYAVRALPLAVAIKHSVKTVAAIVSACSLTIPTDPDKWSLGIVRFSRRNLLLAGYLLCNVPRVWDPDGVASSPGWLAANWLLNCVGLTCGIGMMEDKIKTIVQLELDLLGKQHRSKAAWRALELSARLHTGFLVF